MPRQTRAQQRGSRSQAVLCVLVVKCQPLQCTRGLAVWCHVCMAQDRRLVQPRVWSELIPSGEVGRRLRPYNTHGDAVVHVVPTVSSHCAWFSSALSCRSVLCMTAAPFQSQKAAEECNLGHMQTQKRRPVYLQAGCTRRAQGIAAHSQERSRVREEGGSP